MNTLVLAQHHIHKCYSKFYVHPYVYTPPYLPFPLLNPLLCIHGGGVM